MAVFIGHGAAGLTRSKPLTLRKLHTDASHRRISFVVEQPFDALAVAFGRNADCGEVGRRPDSEHPRRFVGAGGARAE